MTFLKIWLKTLHRKNKRTPLGKILTNRTKLIVLLLSYYDLLDYV